MSDEDVTGASQGEEPPAVAAAGSGAGSDAAAAPAVDEPTQRADDTGVTVEAQADIELDAAAAEASAAGETQTGVDATDDAEPADVEAPSADPRTTDASADQPAEPTAADELPAADEVPTPAEPAATEVPSSPEDVPVEASAEVRAAAAALAQAFGEEPDGGAPADGSAPAEGSAPADEAATSGDEAPTPPPRPSPARLPRPRKTVQLPTKTSWQVRIDDESQVWLTTSAGERLLGPAGGVGELALAGYVRAFDDLVLDVQLLEQRAAAGLELGAVRTKAQAVRDSLTTIPAAGDIDALTIRLETVLALLGDRQRNVQAERAAVKAQIVAAKVVLAEEAESLAQSTEWKKSGDRFLSLVEDWKRLPVTDRTGDTELWKRIRASRDEFGRRRGAHFSELEATRSAVKAAKEKIVVAAEALATSREWGPTASKFGDLMTQWKASGRAERHVDDQLWARFKKAQDAFFGARSEHFSERTGQEKANLALKEGLLAEAEKLVPVSNADAAKRALRAIQDRWEKVGHVPREAMGRLEKRLEAVEKAVSEAAPTSRRPTQVRESQLTIRLRESVAKLEKDLAKAEAANKAPDVAKLKTALATQRDWLAQAVRSA